MQKQQFELFPFSSIEPDIENVLYLISRQRAAIFLKNKVNSNDRKGSCGNKKAL